MLRLCSDGQSRATPANTFRHACSPHLPSTCSSRIVKSSLLFTMKNKMLKLLMWSMFVALSDDRIQCLNANNIHNDPNFQFRTSQQLSQFSICKLVCRKPDSRRAAVECAPNLGPSVPAHFLITMLKQTRTKHQKTPTVPHGPVGPKTTALGVQPPCT